MKKFLIIILALAFGLTVTAQSTQTNVIKNAVKDYDGNSYDAVKIGEQVWMQSNLRTTHYADGTAIELGSEANSKKAYRYYPNDEQKNVPKYGYLYNWTAAMHGAHSSETNPSGIQGICPNGWHLPSNAEWSQLTDFVNHQSLYWCDGDSSNNAKAYAATTGWKTPDEDYMRYWDSDSCRVGNNIKANNATMFSAVPAGYYSFSGKEGFGYCAAFWSSTAIWGRVLWVSYTYFNDNSWWYEGSNKSHGLSVRCIRDSKTAPAPPQIIPLETPQRIPSTAKILKNAVKDYDNNDYDAVQIGEQIWMASNLRTTHYADGRSIALGQDFSGETPLRYYPNNSYSNVTNYGYLYNWAAVMHGASSSTTNPSDVQGICPNGWHVPSQDEWRQLKEYVKKQNKYLCDCEYDHQGIAKSLASNTGWYISIGECDIGNHQQNNNSTGFSAVPAGLYYYSNYEGLGDVAVFWSSTIANNYKTTDGKSCAYDYYLNYREVFSLEEEGTGVKDALSVRCVKDNSKSYRMNLKRYMGEYTMSGFTDGSHTGFADYQYRDAPDGTRIYEGEFSFNDNAGHVAHGEFKNNKQVGTWEWTYKKMYDKEAKTQCRIHFNDDGIPDGDFFVGESSGTFKNGDLIYYHTLRYSTWSRSSFIYGNLKNGKCVGTWSISGADIPYEPAYITFNENGDVSSAYTIDKTTGDKHSVGSNVSNLPYIWARKVLDEVERCCLRSTPKIKKRLAH